METKSNNILNTRDGIYFAITSKTSDAQRANSDQPCSTQPSSYRATARRMRMENSTCTTTSYSYNQFSISRPEEILNAFERAVLDGRYDEAMVQLNEATFMADSMIDELVELLPIRSNHFKPALEFLLQGISDQVRAFLLALTDDQKALALCDCGFEKLRLGIAELHAVGREAYGFKGLSDEEILALAKDNDDNANNYLDFLESSKQFLELGHSFHKAMLAMSLNLRSLSIENFKPVLSHLIEEYSEDNNFDEWFHAHYETTKYSNAEFTFDKNYSIGIPFVIKALEKHLQASFLPENLPVDVRNPMALFLAGRYEETLALLSTPEFENGKDVESFRAACLSLKGCHDEALLNLENQSYDVEAGIVMSLVHFLKGDYEKAKETAIERVDIAFAFMLMLAIHGAQQA